MQFTHNNSQKKKNYPNKRDQLMPSYEISYLHLWLTNKPTDKKTNVLFVLRSKARCLIIIFLMLFMLLLWSLTFSTHLFIQFLIYYTFLPFVTSTSLFLFINFTLFIISVSLLLFIWFFYIPFYLIYLSIPLILFLPQFLPYFDCFSFIPLSFLFSLLHS